VDDSDSWRINAFDHHVGGTCSTSSMTSSFFGFLLFASFRIFIVGGFGFLVLLVISAALLLHGLDRTPATLTLETRPCSNALNFAASVTSHPIEGWGRRVWRNLHHRSLGVHHHFCDDGDLRNGATTLWPWVGYACAGFEAGTRHLPFVLPTTAHVLLVCAWGRFESLFEIRN
jgi:hypothetical protein